MRIAVVGAGGIGGLYGGVLARAGHDVRFLARGEHLRAIQARGLEVRSAELGTFQIQPVAAGDPAELGLAELVILAVKTYDLEPAAQAARALLGPDSTLLTVQNGLDAPDRVAEIVGAGHVLIGTTGLEATILEPGVVGHLSPWHWINVGELNGPPTPRVERLVDLLKAAGLTARMAEDGHRALWQKAAFLIPMAAVTSLCRASIGEIRELPETRELTRALIDEVVAVGEARGHDLSGLSEQVLGNVDSIAPSMKASMARDFERGGRTELEALVGELVRMADKVGVAVPATRVAYAVLKLREKLQTGVVSQIVTSR